MATGGSPQVRHIEWGKVEVEHVGVLKDAKLWPGGGREWDWRETGTQHSPGIQPIDVEELLDAGATTIVLSRGMDLVLKVKAETIEGLRAAGVTVHVLETREAVHTYNSLAANGVPVGALIHSTC
jgi:hypothetical protein